jgi:hypothetical protein
MLTGCDPMITRSYVIKNQTQSTIYVEIISGKTSMTINHGEEKLIYSSLTRGGSRQPEKGYGLVDDTRLLNGSMKIDGNNVPDEIWNIKYWDYTSKKYEGTYALIVTEELLQSLEVSTEP